LLEWPIKHKGRKLVDELVILDFETTGLSPSYARIIEVGAIIIKENIVVDKISQLLYPGSSIPQFITSITGITNQMVKGKPTPEKFMPTLKKFIGNKPILAHNASFDQKFLISEMENIGISIENPFLCTLKLARRLLPNAPNHKLGTLASYLALKIPKNHQAHRALDDVMVTNQIWNHLKNTVTNHIKTEPDLDLFLMLSSVAKNKIAQLLDSKVKT
jgi:DNA polymerase-3 subunit epsilon